MKIKMVVASAESNVLIWNHSEMNVNLINLIPISQVFSQSQTGSNRGDHSSYSYSCIVIWVSSALCWHSFGLNVQCDKHKRLEASGVWGWGRGLENLKCFNSVNLSIDKRFSSRCTVQLKLLWHAHPPTLTLNLCFSAPCGKIWACEDIFW